MKPKPASPENRKIYQHVIDEFTSVTVRGNADDNKAHFIDIAEARNCPERGVISYATLGLSDYPLIFKGEEYSVRIELLGASYQRFAKRTEDFSSALATASFFIMKNKWFCAPGMVFARMLDYYNLSRTLYHLLFVPPALWDNHFNTVLDLGSKRVTWLLAVPISDAEAQLVHEQQSSEQLETLLERYEVDIFDLNRRSVV